MTTRTSATGTAHADGVVRRAGHRVLALQVLLLLWATAWLAPGGAHAAGAPRPTGGDAATLYHNYCSVCHGDQGNGRSRASGALSTRPRDFTSEASRRELTPERIAAAITGGVPGTAMVAWRTQLSAADIDRLAAYVHQRFVRGEAVPGAVAISGTRAHGGREADAASTSARVDTTAGLPNGLKGDPKRGGAFYLANCAACHGAKGDGAGPRAYFIQPKPRNFLDDGWRQGINRIALYAAVSEGRLGTEMPAWSKVAEPQQIADVAEYVFRTFVQPGQRAGAATAAAGGTPAATGR